MATVLVAALRLPTFSEKPQDKLAAELAEQIQLAWGIIGKSWCRNIGAIAQIL